MSLTMAFLEPVRVLHEFGLHEGQVVADLGAGSGFYALAAARMIGPAGKLFAVDVQKELLARLKNAAHTARLKNVHTLHGDMEREGGTTIAAGAADCALVCDVLAQIEQREQFLKEVRRVLRTDGRVLVVDWTKHKHALPQQEVRN